MPAVFRVAENASERGQKQFKLGTLCALLLLFVSSVLGLVDESWAAWISGLGFAGSIVATGVSVFRNAEDDWYDGRAVAESAKTLTWKYAVGGEPLDLARADAKCAYDRALDAIIEEIRRLHSTIVSPAVTSDTDELSAVRGEPLATRRDIYREQRLAQQRSWYSRRARELRSSAKTWQVVTALFQVAGLVGAVLKGLDVVKVDLLSVFAAAAVAAVAWLAANDSTKIARAYEVATLELDHVLSNVDTISEENAWATFVADAEQTMSREHAGWLARRRGP